MKKNFSLYSICWFVALAIFNIACFVSPAQMNGYTKFGGAFWSGYLFITITFLAQLVCAYKTFNSKTKEKFFLNIPIISISYIALILMLIAGVVCMVIPDLPNWIGIIVCFAILGFSAISVVKAYAAGEIVSEIDEKVKTKTIFIKTLTADIETLLKQTTHENIKAEIEKVYEAVRYSDPMSNDALSEIENQITLSFNRLNDVVNSEDYNSIIKETMELIDLIYKRNQKCKLLK